MAKKEKPTTDILKDPVPHTSVSKTVSDAVIGSAIKAGSTVLSVMAGLLAAVLILYSGYVLYDSFFTMNNAVTDSWDLLEYKPEIIEDGMTPLTNTDTLRDINDDYRAWLTVYDTTIDYPVVQGENDLYYASHDIYGRTSLTGAIYLAAANDAHLKDSYNLIYGHHMDNKAMFGGLDAFKDESYFNSHREGLIIGTSGIYDIEFFAVATADAYESVLYTVGDRAADVISYLAAGGTTSGEDGVDGVQPQIATNVLYFDAAVAQDAEKVIALSTCANATTNGRLLVFGKMVKRNVLVLDAIGYEGIYDGEDHFPEINVSIEEGTEIVYSIDGGETWTKELPSIRNVGEITVMIKAENETAGSAKATVTLKVNPRPVTVTALDAFKTYGSPDPDWEAILSGTLPGEEGLISYLLSRTPGENAGSYPITPSGDEVQGNYIVTYIPGRLIITSAGTLAVTATGYAGVYDGQPHYADYSVNVTEGTLIEFSTDGGNTWTTEIPNIIDPGQIPVIVRATNPNYGTAYATAVLLVWDNPVPDDQVSLTVVKVWSDNNNADGARPTQLYMILTGGGEARTVQLGAANNWSATLQMPRYDANGNEIAYTWTEPEVAGYTMTSQTTEDGVTIITNTRNSVTPQPQATYTLTIRYRYLDGTEAAATYTATLAPGSIYDVTSPVIAGYTASNLRIAGTMPAQNVEYVVLYIPEGTNPLPEEMTILIESNRTPLAGGTIFINVGDCFE